jgi:hypothetical protein
VIHNNGCFGHKRLHRLEQLFGLFPRLRCAIASDVRGASFDLEAVLFEVMPAYQLRNLIQSAASLVSGDENQLCHGSMISFGLFKTLHLDFTRISLPEEYSLVDLSDVQPVCDNLDVSSSIGKSVTRRWTDGWMDKSIMDISADVAKTLLLALLYEPLSKKGTVHLNISYSHFFFVENILCFVSAICRETETSFLRGNSFSFGRLVSMYRKPSGSSCA